MKAIIQTPTPDFNLSVNFYKKLGFQITQKAEHAFAQSGDNLTILINADRFSRAGLILFGNDWNAFLTEKNLANKSTKTKTGFLIKAPSGCCVYLDNNTPSNLPVANQPTVLGNFSGLSLETNQMEDSVAFWSIFGFKQNGGNIDHGWISMINADGFGIGLMKYNCCPHLFFNPSISFFNGDKNLEIIEKIRNLEIPITEEITHFNSEGIVDNIIIRDPGGLGYFLFSD